MWGGGGEGGGGGGGWGGGGGGVAWRTGYECFRTLACGGGQSLKDSDSGTVHLLRTSSQQRHSHRLLSLSIERRVNPLVSVGVCAQTDNRCLVFITPNLKPLHPPCLSFYLCPSLCVPLRVCSSVYFLYAAITRVGHVSLYLVFFGVFDLFLPPAYQRIAGFRLSL